VPETLESSASVPYGFVVRVGGCAGSAGTFDGAGSDAPRGFGAPNRLVPVFVDGAG